MTQGQFQEELLRAPGEGAWLFVAIKARWEHLLLNYYNASSSAAPVQLFLRKLTQCSLYVAVSHGTRIPTWKILVYRWVFRWSSGVYSPPPCSEVAVDRPAGGAKMEHGVKSFLSTV